MQCPKCTGTVEESDIRVQPCPCLDGIEVAFTCPGCRQSFFCLLSPNTFLQDLGKPTAADVPDEGVTVSILSLVGVTVDEAVVAGWNAEQRLQAVDWAGAIHLQASDNDDVEVPKMPVFLRHYLKNPFMEVT
jgi:hypothetical protein